jgi:hypothetical protein
VQWRWVETVVIQENTRKHDLGSGNCLIYTQIFFTQQHYQTPFSLKIFALKTTAPTYVLEYSKEEEEKTGKS